MGMPAARTGEFHSCPVREKGRAHEGGPILDGSADVFIAGMPAARVGDKLQCNGASDTIIEGEPSVLINGKAAARLGDKTAHGGVILTGCDSVLIGTRHDLMQGLGKKTDFYERAREFFEKEH